MHKGQVMSKISLTALLRAMVDQDASDLHLACNTPPQFRIHGKLFKAKSDNLTPDVIRELVYEILTDEQKAEFEEEQELDFSFGVKDVARFRGNLFFQRGSVGAVFRKIAM